MPTPLLSSPPVPGQHGYACKVWIARDIEQRHLGGRYYVWFSKQLNPLQNGDSSNPISLYLSIDRAVKLRDANHPKIKDLRANLRQAVGRLLGPRNSGLAKRLKRVILRAPLDMFRPQLWRLDLSAISARRVVQGEPNWDEWVITDLQAGEFDVIVD